MILCSSDRASVRAGPIQIGAMPDRIDAARSGVPRLHSTPLARTRRRRLARHLVVAQRTRLPTHAPLQVHADPLLVLQQRLRHVLTPVPEHPIHQPRQLVSRRRDRPSTATGGKRGDSKYFRYAECLTSPRIWDRAASRSLSRMPHERRIPPIKLPDPYPGVKKFRDESAQVSEQPTRPGECSGRAGGGPRGRDEESRVGTEQERRGPESVVD